MFIRIFKSTGLSFIIFFVSMIGQIVSIPILLTYWGPQVYGEWITLTSMVLSLTILNLGVQTYVTNLLIAYYVRGEINEGTKILHAAFRLYILLGSVAIIFVFAFTFWPELPTILNINSISRSNVQWIILIQGLLVVFALFEGLLMSLLIVVNKLPRRLVYSLIKRLLFLFTPMVAAIFGGGALEAISIMGVLTIVVAGVQIKDVMHQSPFSIGIFETTWDESLKLIRPSLMFLALSLTTQLLTTGVIIIISSSINAFAVTIYTTTLMMTNFIRGIINQGMNVLWPEITAEAAVDNNLGRLSRWHRLVFKLAGNLVLLSAAALGLMGYDLLMIWTNGRVQVDNSLNLLFILYLIIQTPALIGRIFGLATNRQRELIRLEITTMVISIILSAWTVSVWGVNGAVVALIFGQVIGTIWILLLVCYWIGDEIWGFLKEGVVRGIPTMCALLIMSLGIWFLSTELVWRGIGYFGVLIISSFIAWKTWFINQERNMLAVKIRAIIVEVIP